MIYLKKLVGLDVGGVGQEGGRKLDRTWIPKSTVLEMFSYFLGTLSVEKRKLVTYLLNRDLSSIEQFSFGIRSLENRSMDCFEQIFSAEDFCGRLTAVVFKEGVFDLAQASQEPVAVSVFGNPDTPGGDLMGGFVQEEVMDVQVIMALFLKLMNSERNKILNSRFSPIGVLDTLLRAAEKPYSEENRLMLLKQLFFNVDLRSCQTVQSALDLLGKEPVALLFPPQRDAAVLLEADQVFEFGFYGHRGLMNASQEITRLQSGSTSESGQPMTASFSVVVPGRSLQLLHYAANSQGNAVYTEDVCRTLLSRFATAYQLAKDSGLQTVWGGNVGAGVFGHAKSMVYALQMLAAVQVGITLTIYSPDRINSSEKPEDTDQSLFLLVQELVTDMVNLHRQVDRLVRFDAVFGNIVELLKLRPTVAEIRQLVGKKTYFELRRVVDGLLFHGAVHFDSFVAFIGEAEKFYKLVEEDQKKINALVDTLLVNKGAAEGLNQVVGGSIEFRKMLKATNNQISDTEALFQAHNLNLLEYSDRFDSDNRFLGLYFSQIRSQENLDKLSAIIGSKTIEFLKGEKPKYLKKILKLYKEFLQRDITPQSIFSFSQKLQDQSNFTEKKDIPESAPVARAVLDRLMVLAGVLQSCFSVMSKLELKLTASKNLVSRYLPSSDGGEDDAGLNT